MNPGDIELVRQSFMVLLPRKMALADAFYRHLFEIEPDLRALFPDDLTGQGEKLMHTLATLIRGLASLDKVVPLVEDLGRRHRAYRAEPAHYAGVGIALISAMKELLADEFTPEMAAAWERAYAVLSEVMIRGANQSAQASGQA